MSLKSCIENVIYFYARADETAGDYTSGILKKMRISAKISLTSLTYKRRECYIIHEIIADNRK